MKIQVDRPGIGTKLFRHLTVLDEKALAVPCHKGIGKCDGIAFHIVPADVVEPHDLIQFAGNVIGGAV